MSDLNDAAKALLSEAFPGWATTLRSDGSLHSTVVWVDLDGDDVIFNTAVGRAKEKNLRADPRVINLERTNLASLGPHLVAEPAGLLTIDLSYLSVADAIGQVDRRLLTPSAQLIALVKPTFELRAPTLANQPGQVTAAVEAASRALEAHGWDGHWYRRAYFDDGAPLGRQVPAPLAFSG